MRRQSRFPSFIVTATSACVKGRSCLGARRAQRLYFFFQLALQPVRILPHDDVQIALRVGKRPPGFTGLRLFRRAALSPRTPLPQTDLRRYCPPVQNQGSLVTCTAHAVAAAFCHEQLVRKMRVIPPSRLFIYYNERALIHQRSLNCVVRLHDALKVVANRGVRQESLWPYRG